MVENLLLVALLPGPKEISNIGLILTVLIEELKEFFEGFAYKSLLLLSSSSMEFLFLWW